MRTVREPASSITAAGYLIPGQAEQSNAVAAPVVAREATPPVEAAPRRGAVPPINAPPQPIGTAITALPHEVRSRADHPPTAHPRNLPPREALLTRHPAAAPLRVPVRWAVAVEALAAADAVQVVVAGKK